MTSPSSSIVVVDKSGLVETSNLIQSSTSQHIHQLQQQQQSSQHQQIHAQQVIVNEEYLSGDTIVTTGNVNYLKTNDLLNNAQIIQFVSDEQAAIIENQSIVGQSQDEYMSPVLPQTLSTNPNSKVHVISNVTLVSKADQPQQTISFVNSKHVQSSGGSAAAIATGNFVNTYISSKAAVQLQNKIVNIPFKTTTIAQMEHSHHHQSQPQIQTVQHQQQQQQHIITKHLNNASAIVQKIPIPRNIHVLSTGRLQSLGDELQTTTTIARNVMSHQQINQLGNVIQIQKPLSNAIAIGKANLNVNSVKNTKNNQQTIKLVNQTIAAAAASNSTIKHSVSSGGIKMVSSTAIGATSHPNAIQQKNQTKSSKIIKHNNNNSNNNLNNNIASMPSSSSFSNSSHTGSNSSLSSPQSKTPHKTNNNINNNNNNINNNNNNNNNNINVNNNNNNLIANSKLVQQTQRSTITTLNNICMQPNIIGQKVVGGKNAAGKYLVQPNQISHIVLPPTQQSSHLHTNTQKLSSAAHVYQSDHNQTQYQAQQQLQSGSIGGASGTIKYVNAQGNIITAPNSRYRTMLHHPLTAAAADQSVVTVQQQQHQQQHMYTEISSTPVASDAEYKNQQATNVTLKSSTNPSSVDDIIMVNGTHMSEEMSARILQSLSQKSVFNNNNNNNINTNTKYYRHSKVQQQLQPQTQPQASHTMQFSQQIVSHQVKNKQSHQQQQQRVYLASSDYPYSHIAQQSIEQRNKNGPEYFRVNTSDIQSTTSTFVDNIPLISTRVDDHYQHNSSNANDQDDDIIGEEVRPSPIDSTMDARMQALHSLLQDHTYVQLPKKSSSVPTTSTATTAIGLASANSVSATQTLGTTSISSASIVSSPSSAVFSSSASSVSNREKQSTTSQIIDSVVAGAGGNCVSIPNRNLLALPATIPVNKYQHQPSNVPNIPGFSFSYNVLMGKDDDADSIISTGSRTNKSDIDLGEETETAPEGEGEDDSVTRCICELTHDDGYMICCDKCSVWQHVDCMGIDRQNIPEEYKCELCQPRSVDHNRARVLQLMKRKEQQNFLLLNSQQSQQQTLQQSGLPIDPNISQIVGPMERTQLNAFSNIAANKKKGMLTAKGRKVDLFGTGSSTANKRKRSESSRTGNSKRRETKKSSSKRKFNSASNSNATTPVKPQSGNDNVNEKQAANLRAWIENYEAAMTNHYSPELRARLHSLIKQSPTSPPAIPMLKSITSLDNKCTTVPHAGAKILISTLEILPNNPVIEIRGKYMLGTQYKPQQPTTVQTTINSRNLSKSNPGPFLFFYRLPNDGLEICVDTRTYGNEARFVRRSCRPNAEILHTIEKGALHLYIVSLNTIKSSTEITIKHEPHDLESLTRGEITAPTSTICGCGLIKDCLFGAATANVNPAVPQPMPVSTKKSSKRTNGHIKEKSVSSATMSQRKKRKNSHASNRNRSTSSSGDSNLCLISPTSTKSLAHIPHTTDEVISIQQTENETLPSSPKQSSTPLAVDSITQDCPQKDLTLEHSNTTTAQLQPTDKSILLNQSPQSEPEPPVQQPNALLSSPICVTIKPIPVGMKSPQTIPLTGASTDSLQPSKDFAAVDVEVPPSSPCKPNQEEKPLKSPPLTPVLIIKSPTFNKSSCHKKTTRKSTCSLSEDNSSIAGDEFPAVTHSNPHSATKKEKEPKKAVENKKLTREERKMEAIVRAFEKMEKTEQRKNEQNKHKSVSNVPSTGVTSSASRKRRASSSHIKDKGDGEKTPTKKVNSQQGRRKRKRGKSYSQFNHQRRRRNRLDSHNSDINTSEDSSTPMMSPTLLSPSSQDYDRHKDTTRQLADVTVKKQTDSDLAAGLLLSLSSYASNKSSDKNCVASPDRFNKSTPNTPPFPISSACLLIEAAVGPLDNDFKLPTKTKTKKTIMNEWLHQSDVVSSFSSQNLHQNPDQLLSPSTSIDNYSHAESNTLTTYHEEPQNLSIAAQKIEEFIHLSTSEQHDDDESSKWSGSPICTSSEPMTVPTPLPTPPLQMGSSVKKRWLRQAISEECSDELLANSSATSSPPNGFMAPLKKRRVARQCSDLTTENLPSPSLPSVYDSIEEKSENLLYDDKMDDTNDDVSPPQYPSAIEQEFDSYAETTNDLIDVKPEPKLEESTETVDVKQFVEMQAIEKTEVEKVEQSLTDIVVDADEKVQIKMEVEDTETYPPCEIEDDSKAVPSSSYEEKSTVEQSSTDFHSTEVKQEDESKEIDMIKAEDIPLPPVVLPKDEIEDIQQKLLSFHSENLMILQSRNKKRVSRATTPTLTDESASNTSNSQPKDIAPNNEYVKKIRKCSVDDREYKREDSASNRNQIEDENLYNSNAPALTPQPHQNTLLNTSGYSSYLLNNTHRSDINQQQHIPLPVPQLYQPAMTPPSFANIHPQLSANVSSTNSLYHYLENPNRPTSYSTLGYTTQNAMIDQVNVAPVMRQHSMFSMHTNLPPPTLLNSSNYLTKSYSTLSEPPATATIATSPAAPVATTINNNPLTPKILTRTQSADPRLNPPKDLPPVTPKRKLSINEYRKRKQLTIGGDKTKPDEREKSESKPDLILKSMDLDDKPKNGMTTTETKETVFSPAPTLLEMQQENLSRRLKSYKSLHGLTSQIELRKPKDPSSENDELGPLRKLESSMLSSSNSSLTSIHSPPSLKSDRNFDVDENDGDRTPTFNETIDHDLDNLDADDNSIVSNDLLKLSPVVRKSSSSSSSFSSDLKSPEPSAINPSSIIESTKPLNTMPNEGNSEALSETNDDNTTPIDETMITSLSVMPEGELNTTAASTSGNISPNENTSR